MEEELVMGATSQAKRIECSFDLAGDKRIKQAVMCHRLDTNMNMTASFKPANMVCHDCTERSPHSVIGGEGREPVVLVATYQNFPRVLFSENNGACIAVCKFKEIGSL